MDTDIISLIEEEMNDLVNEYTAPEIIESINKIKVKINEYKNNPSEKLKIELMILLDKII